MDFSLSRQERLARQISLIGAQADDRLARSSVLIFGAGGVGGAVIEAVARAGVGRITVVDFDSFAPSNLNRQLLCAVHNIGHDKAQEAADRIRAVSPDCDARAVHAFVTAENTAQIISEAAPDFICDAVDNVTAKIQIIEYAVSHNIPVISSMGTGNKLDPFAFRIAPIETTSVCPLARVMRRELKLRGISGVPVLFSTEQPQHTNARTPASISYVPTCAGFMIGGYIIRRLAQI